MPCRQRLSRRTVTITGWERRRWPAGSCARRPAIRRPATRRPATRRPATGRPAPKQTSACGMSPAGGSLRPRPNRASLPSPGMRKQTTSLTRNRPHLPARSPPPAHPRPAPHPRPQVAVPPGGPSWPPSRWSARPGRCVAGRAVPACRRGSPARDRRRRRRSTGPRGRRHSACGMSRRSRGNRARTALTSRIRPPRAAPRTPSPAPGCGPPAGIRPSHRSKHDRRSRDRRSRDRRGKPGRSKPGQHRKRDRRSMASKASKASKVTKASKASKNSKASKLGRRWSPRRAHRIGHRSGSPPHALSGRNRCRPSP